MTPHILSYASIPKHIQVSAAPEQYSLELETSQETTLEAWPLEGIVLGVSVVGLTYRRFRVEGPGFDFSCRTYFNEGASCEQGRKQLLSPCCGPMKLGKEEPMYLKNLL